MKRYLLLVVALVLLLTACKNVDTSNDLGQHEENDIIASDEKVNSDEVTGENVNSDEIIIDNNESTYLELNKTTVVDIMSRNQQSFEYDELGNIVTSSTFELGELKVGNSKYTLVVSNIENWMKLSLINNNEVEYDLYEGPSFENTAELTVYKDKYLFFAIRDTSNDGIQSNLEVLDENLNKIIDKNIYYDNSEKKFDYEFLDNKISFSAYEALTEEDRKINEIPEFMNLYRVYYEIIEENNTLKINKTRDDYSDYSMTAVA